MLQKDKLDKGQNQRSLPPLCPKVPAPKSSTGLRNGPSPPLPTLGGLEWGSSPWGCSRGPTSISPSLSQSVARLHPQKSIQFSKGLRSQECQEPCCGLWEKGYEVPLDPNPGLLTKGLFWHGAECIPAERVWSQVALGRVRFQARHTLGQNQEWGWGICEGYLGRGRSCSLRGNLLAPKVVGSSARGMKPQPHAWC